MLRIASVPLLLALALLASGCAWMRGDWEDPQVAIAALRMGPGEGLYQQIYIDLIITNPNRSQLALEGISYRVGLEGHELVRGVSREPLRVAPGASARYTVPAGFSLLSSAGLIRDLLMQPRQSLRYELEVTLDPVGWMFGKVKIDKSDTIPLSR